MRGALVHAMPATKPEAVRVELFREPIRVTSLGDAHERYDVGPLYAAVTVRIPVWLAKAWLAAKGAWNG